jgi:hypothetical protein
MHAWRIHGRGLRYGRITFSSRQHRYRPLAKQRCQRQGLRAALHHATRQQA